MKRAFINDKGKLVIVNSNATMCDGETRTDIFGEFEIDAEDLMKIYGLLSEKETVVFRSRQSVIPTEYIITSSDVFIAHLLKDLHEQIEKFNNTRHWWERKIKIERTL